MTDSNPKRGEYHSLLRNIVKKYTEFKPSGGHCGMKATKGEQRKSRPLFQLLVEAL